MRYYVYIVRCADNYLYTGLTKNIEKRLGEHKKGLSRLTKNRGKIVLAFKQSFNSIFDAAKREKEIKGWKREKKERLIACSEEQRDEERP